MTWWINSRFPAHFSCSGNILDLNWTASRWSLGLAQVSDQLRSSNTSVGRRTTKLHSDRAIKAHYILTKCPVVLSPEGLYYRTFYQVCQGPVLDGTMFKKWKQCRIESMLTRLDSQQQNVIIMRKYWLTHYCRLDCGEPKVLIAHDSLESYLWGHLWCCGGNLRWGWRSDWRRCMPPRICCGSKHRFVFIGVQYEQGHISVHVLT